MKKFVILLILCGLVFPCIEINASALGNDTSTIQPTDCIYIVGSNHTILVNFTTINNIVLLNSYSANYTDTQRNLIVKIDQTALESQYKRNDAFVFPVNQQAWNNVTFTTYSSYVPAESFNLTNGQNMTYRNLTFSCQGIPSTYCYQNISKGNVSDFYNEATNISIDCRANINKTLGNGEVFNDIIHNISLVQFNHTQNIEWHLGFSSVQFNPICNITAYGPTLDSIKTNTSANLTFGQELTDAISGNKYKAPLASTCPYKLKNVSQTLVAPAKYTDTDTNVSIDCTMPTFQTNDPYIYNSSAGCSVFGRVCMDYFDDRCNDTEKRTANLAACVNRLQSPEEWTTKLSVAQNLSDAYMAKYQDCDLSNRECQGTLTSGDAFMSKIWYLVIAFFVGCILGGLILIGIMMYRKQNIKGSRPTAPPHIGGNVISAEKYVGLKTPPKSGDTNSVLLPRGYKEG